MLLMINKILLPSLKRDIVYETLEDEWSKKPYVFHTDNLRPDAKAWVHKDIELDFLISGEVQVYLDDKPNHSLDKDAHSPELVLIKKGLYPKT